MLRRKELPRWTERDLARLRPGTIVRRAPLRRRAPLARGSVTLARSPIQRVSAAMVTLKELRALLNAVVVARDGGRCRSCGAGRRPGRGGGLQAAHILPKGTYPSMEFDLDNVLCLCASCHLYGPGAWHKDPLAAARLIERLYGPWFMDTLRRKALVRRAKVDKALIRLYLEQKLVEFGGRV